MNAELSSLLRAADMIPKVGWQLQAFADAPALRAFARRLRTAFPDLDVNHDVEWIAEAHGWPKNELLVLADRAGEEISGVATLPISKAPLVYAFGRFALLKLSVRQFKLYQGLTCSHSDRARAVGACFDALFEAMPEGSVVFAGAVPIGCELQRQLVDPASPLRRRFHVLPWGAESQHCRIHWEGSFEKYLATIGKASRKDLRRSARALLDDPTVKCRLRRFRSDDVEAFLRDGVSVSDKTYQKRDFGLGISLGGAVERVIRFAASRGSFFGYIFYINDAPVAFKYGFIWGKTCIMKQTGYDPAWAHRNVGSVLFSEVLRDFDLTKLPAEYLDFMPDVNLFKLRTANDRRQIRHYYLFKRTLAGTVQYLSLMVTDFLSRFAGALVKRLRGAEPGELEKYVSRSVADAPKT